jgi:hypothetical protein
LTEEQVIENVANNYHQVYVLSKLLLAENNPTTTTKVRDCKGQSDNGLAKELI